MRWPWRRQSQTRVPLESGDRPTVVLEYPSYATPSVVAQALRDAGFDVVTCEGPGDEPTSCLLLQHGRCPLAERADVVINGFGLGDQDHRDIITELRDTYLDTPVIVEATRPQVEAHPDTVEGCRVLFSPLTTERLVDAVSHEKG